MQTFRSYHYPRILSRLLISIVMLLTLTTSLLSWARHPIAYAAVTEVICDNLDGCFSKYESAGVGSWGYIPSGTIGANGAYNGHAYWTYNTLNGAIDWGLWRPSLPQTGTYDVYIWYPHFPGIVPETNSAHYVIHGVGGDQAVTWDQAINAALWNKVATVSCTAGTACYVQLTDQTNESTSTRRVWMDAVKFVLVPPVLQVAPASLSFSAVQGGASPAAQTLSISNGSSGTLNWTASENVAWLSLDTTSGSAPATLNVTANPTGLSTGTYTGTITLSAAGATGSPATINVSLTVTAPAPVLQVAPTSLSFTAVQGGGSPAAQTLSISNGGGGTITWTASESLAWLSLDAASGSAPATLNVTANPTGLSTGTYTGTITLSAVSATGSPTTISVTLTVTAPAPVLQVAPTSLSFSTPQGGANPAAQTLSITNGGGGTLNWTASESLTWLSLNATSGTAPASLSITVDSTGLSTGTYNGAVTVSASGVSGSPTTISVSLTVDPPVTSGDPYEPDDTCAQAQTITPDGTVQDHTFHIAADHDWVRFDAIARTTYQIAASVPPGSPADVRLDLFDQCAGNGQTFQDESFSAGVRLEVKAPATGPLYLQFQNHTPAVAGPDVAYTLNIQTLAAVPTPGALIVVAGRYKNFDPLQPNIHAVTSRVVTLFTDRGYPPDRIQFLATDPSLAGYDAPATLANLESAITTWATTRVGPGRPLTLYLMDHGNYDTLYLDRPHGQKLTPAQLDGWLSQLEAAHPGLVVNVIIEACLSGSFIDPQQQVSKPGRVVITSTGAHNNAQASGSGAFFSDAFLTALEGGASLYSSFQTAAWAVDALPYGQTPWLDDNGDGIANTRGEGTVAATRGFGYAGSLVGAEDAWPPYIAAAPPPEVTPGQGRLRVQVLDDGTVARVWAVLYPPGYQPPAAGEELVADTLPTVELKAESDGWYSGGAGLQVGTSQVVVYATDNAGYQAQPVVLVVQQPTGRVFLPLLMR